MRDLPIPGVFAPRWQKKLEAFVKLCNYLEENDECQYSLKELMEKMKSFYDGDPDGDKVYETKYLRDKLAQHFGDQVIITRLKGRQDNVVTFRDMGYKLFKDKWESDKKANVTAEKQKIIVTQGTLICVVQRHRYPFFFLF